MSSTILSRWSPRFLGVALLSAVLATFAAGTPAAAQEPLKIGIIGTGKIGGALARHWVAAGHEVLMSSRHPEELEALALELGPRAHVGIPREAAAFGSVVLVSVPYGAMPQIGTDFSAELQGKVDAAAVAIGERLVRDAGFDPVVVGTLAQTRQFDLGQPLAVGNLSAEEFRGRMTASR